MLKKLKSYLLNKRIKKEAFVIGSSPIKSKPSEVFVLRKGLLYVLDDKIVHLTFNDGGVELGQSIIERNFTLLAYAILIGSFLFVPIYAFAKGAWYLGIPYSFLLVPMAYSFLKNLKSSATPMILKDEVQSVFIKNILFPVLIIHTHEDQVFRVAIGNGVYIRKSVRMRLKSGFLEKGYPI